MKDIATIILAAGKGTRMKSDVPKVLHQVCGEPMIRHVLELAKSIGSAKTYVVLGHKIDVVKQHLSDDVIVVEQKKLLGTADAIKCVQKYLKNYKGNVLILSGDAPLLHKSTIKNIIRRHKKLKAECTFLTTVMHNPDGYGRILRDEAGRVMAIREDRDAIGFERNIAEINVGVYCFRCQDLYKALENIKLNPNKKEFYLTDVIEAFTSDKLKVETIQTDEPLEGLGINTREDLAVAEDTMRQRVLKEFMRQGVTIVDPRTTYIAAQVRIGKDTIIRPNTFIENDVVIGHNCTIGPFAHIRPGSRIGNYVELGNFTEVSRTKIGDRTFMKHFSFLGDATLGSNVNIGAGTITANFDGKEKHPTKIANDAFIGCDAILIAPTKIGKKAMVGAGSVVPRGKNIPDGALAVGIPARVIARRNR